LVLEGANYEKVLFIISEKSEEIRNKIVIDLNRGGTFLKGEGMWGHNEKSIIFTVVNRREMSMLQEYINHIDPKAFVTVLNATEILGNGFKSLKDKIAE